jgi:hypothetical protein
VTHATIPDHNHVARYCGGKHVEGEKVGPTAFHLREGEQSLSVNWIEILSKQSREEEIDELRSVYAKKLKRVGSTAKIAVMNVGVVRASVFAKCSIDLAFLHDPLPEDPSHSGIYEIPPDGEMEVIGELIAEMVNEVYPAVQSEAR